MRNVFFSFDWDDVWRVNQVRNSAITRGCAVAGFRDVAEIEAVRKKGDVAIERWIDKQMLGTSVTCVLIGRKTSHSKWVKYEINKSLEMGKGILGVHIHNLKGSSGRRSASGESPICAKCGCGIFWCRYAHYDWEDNDGYRNFGDWVEAAAKKAGK